jgi:two-component system sensor histidine kinase DctS
VWILGKLPRAQKLWSSTSALAPMWFSTMRGAARRWPRLIDVPDTALPPLALKPPRWRGLWLLPLALALALIAAVLVSLRQTEQNERLEQREALITDALSVRQQIEQRVDAERQRLKSLAQRIEIAAPSAAVFGSLPEVYEGLQRSWISVTWLNASNRIVAQLPEHPAGARVAAPSGLTTHIAQPLATGGSLIVRYSPGVMLRQIVPWWIAHKYDVRLVDTSGAVIASTFEGTTPADRESYSLSLVDALGDANLELIARDAVKPWYRSVPVALIASFGVLIVLSTVMLRRQMREVLRAEEAWRGEAAWRKAMEDSLNVGLRARDLEGRLVYVNRTLAEMLGYAPEELVGLAPPMPYWPPDTLEATMERHRRNLAGEAPREGYEATWCRRDGSRFPVMIFEAPLVDAHGRQIGWMGSIIDITERRRLEEREQRQTEMMAHHARLTMLGEIASTLAHELNQPLTAIAGYGAGALNSLERGGGADPTVLRALQRLGEQAAHAGAIVQRIRDFLTRREPELEPCDINAVVRGAVALLARDLHRANIVVRLKLDAPARPIVADTVLIEQVVINLVRNAADALAHHERHDRRVEVATSLSADGRFVRIDVTDNGPGLNGRTIEQLCAPFYSTKAEGMGMGLAICRSIIEAHHGVFDAGEAFGGGARFSLTLPVGLQAQGPSERGSDE